MSTDITRRTILGSCGGGVLIAVAGCASIQSKSAEHQVTFSDIHIENWHEKPHTVSIIIYRDDELVYWKTVNVGARGGEAPSSITFEDHPTESGNYRLLAKLKNDSFDSWQESTFDQYDGCISVSVWIGSPSQNQGALNILTSGECNAYKGEGNKSG